MKSIEELEQDLAELRSLRPDARALARSGNPALRAEGERSLAEIEDAVRFGNATLRRVLDADQ